jgi:hypothetical protein
MLGTVKATKTIKSSPIQKCAFSEESNCWIILHQTIVVGVTDSGVDASATNNNVGN